MTDTPRATLEKLNDEGNGLRVEFYWLGDRLGHTIFAVKDGVATVQWRSVDDDPLGPVYQELHEQEADAGGKILFLNGAGNGTHWSASVEFVPKSLVFDVAARVHTLPTVRRIDYQKLGPENPLIRMGYIENGIGNLIDSKSPVARIEANSACEAVPTTLRFKYEVF